MAAQHERSPVDAAGGTRRLTERPASSTAGAVALVLPEHHGAIVPGRREGEAVGAEAHDVDRLRPRDGAG